MTIAQLFRKFFGPVEREAGIVVSHVEADAHSAVHFVEKEFKMFDLQVISDTVARIKAKFASESALQQQVSDLTAAGQAKDKQIADLTTANDTLTKNLSDLQAQLLDVSPDPNAQPAQQNQPPSDGSGSADQTPV